MKLSTLSILLGLAVALPQLYGLAKPKAFGEAVRRFPRNTGLGYVLMGLATTWFLYNLKQESIADFEAYKKIMLLGFGALGLGTCIYVQDFLPVRGAAILMLLLGKLMVDTARWHESDWRLVIVTWAYLLVIAGMWFTISPWRVRDLIEWGTANEKRIQTTCAARLAFGLIVVGLGVMVF
jgi:hypothetical protein